MNTLDRITQEIAAAGHEHPSEQHKLAIQLICKEIDALKGVDASNDSRRSEKSSSSRTDVTPPPVGQAGGEDMVRSALFELEPAQCSVLECDTCGMPLKHGHTRPCPRAAWEVLRNHIASTKPKSEPLSKTEEFDFRTGLPVEALRNVCKTWFCDAWPSMIVFSESTTGSKDKPLGWRFFGAEGWNFDTIHDPQRKFTPAGRTWAAVEVMAAEHLGLSGVGSAHRNDRGPMTLPALMKRLGYTLPIEQETPHMQNLYVTYRVNFKPKAQP